MSTIHVQRRSARDADGRGAAGSSLPAPGRGLSKDRYEASLETMFDPFVILRAVRDESGSIVDFVYEYANKAACDFNRVPREELVGMRLLALLPAHDSAGLIGQYAQVVETGEPLVVDDLRYEDEWGNERLSRVFSMRANKLGDGLTYTWRDVTAARAAEAELRHSEQFISAIADNMAEGLVAIERDGSVRYMNGAAERMLGWSKDELRGRRMHDLVHGYHPDGSRYPIEECPVTLVATTGESVKVDDETFICRNGDLLPVAYSASPLQTEEIDGVVIVFRDVTAERDERLRRDREIEQFSWMGRMRDALDQDRFVLHAQPIVDLQTGRTTQHELLIRMLSETGTLIAPAQFLPTAERFGLIAEIDDWVINQAARLSAQGRTVQFNVSAESITGNPQLFRSIEAAIKKAGGDPELLVCEITETALIKDPDAARAFVISLSELGCKVALDDFGTGYSNFTALKHLPVAYLKIDIEFVRDIVENPASRHVVSAIVSLARGFGQKTIAEGVEDPRASQLLAEMGVDYAQGYAIGRPVPLQEAYRDRQVS